MKQHPDVYFVVNDEDFSHPLLEVRSVDQCGTMPDVLQPGLRAATRVTWGAGRVPAEPPRHQMGSTVLKRLLVCASEVDVQMAVVHAAQPLELMVVATATSSEARRRADSADFQGAVITFSNLLDPDREVRALVGALAPGPVVLLAAADQVERALELLKHGVRDVIAFPASSAMLRHRLARCFDAAPRGAAGDGGARPTVARDHGLLGDSAPMRAVRQRIEKLASTDLPVAIYGESGTGKELAATMIHAASRRRNGPLVVANCAAMPETLFENELFGHERGSYTGAMSTSGGLIEEAAGGTLVLDEIGELPLMLQAKLLRLVQFSTYRRVGGSKHLQAHVRIIAVTNRDLREASEQQLFRRDLYYRINVLHVSLPPLRQHIEDLPALAQDIADRFCRAHGLAPVTFAADALELLMLHRWPGNVRELESIIQSTLALDYGQVIGARHIELGLDRDLPPSRTHVGLEWDLSLGFADGKQKLLEQFERAYLVQALERSAGNVAAAARDARIDRKTMWRLLRKYGLDADEFRAPGELHH
ncbi:MAG: sigma-54-dependent Fis family transcriptional regulator [Deltaproteobacteria bacterium]|nr:sigma-54-dependent Fis family transcriptional regulator [Deltaproteobacteria bacterium]MCB9786293.1 sigma-54-dependent Fis family transcriptional regulator [Deltaproteobacteria bacterium]